MIRSTTAPTTVAVVLLAAACGADPDPPLPPRFCGDPIPQQKVFVEESKSVEVCFEDPGGGNLTKSAVSSDTSVAQASPRGDSVALRGVSPGDATITVTVTNADDLSADTSFSVLVSNRAQGSEREALVALYEATGGPGWARKGNWLSDEPLSEWEGLATNPDGTVFWLDLSNNRLEGRLPAQIGDLPRLGHLRLQNNRLEGPLPAELANASDMGDLDLSQNGFTGPIPAEFTQMTNFYRLYWLDNDGLCAPTDQEFQDWLAGIPYTGGPNC